MQFRLKELMAERERVSGRRQTYRLVSDATGIAISTLHRIGTNNQKRIDLSTVDRLCGYFHCEVGDLIVRIPGNGDGTQ